MKASLKVGDKVVYCPGFGTDAPVEVTVEELELTPYPDCKHGDLVDEVSWDQVREDLVVFGLSNDKWSYSYQIDIEASLKLQKS